MVSSHYLLHPSSNLTPNQVRRFCKLSANSGQLWKILFNVTYGEFTLFNLFFIEPDS